MIICDDAQSTKAVIAEIMLESELSIPQIHPYAFTASNLFEMLANKEANYGKEIAGNCLLITGAKQYYEIVLRAANNGFNG